MLRHALQKVDHVKELVCVWPIVTGVAPVCEGSRRKERGREGRREGGTEGMSEGG